MVHIDHCCNADLQGERIDMNKRCSTATTWPSQPTGNSGASQDRYFLGARDLGRRNHPLYFVFMVAVLVLWIGSLLAWIPQLHAAVPIHIAAIFSQTGIAAAHNEPLISMVQLAVEEINQSGGILNRPVQLILLDNQSTPIGAAVAAEAAVKMGVTAVIGAHWSSHSLAMAPILQKAGIPMISPGSTNPEVTKTGDFIFRVCFLDSFQGIAMARFAHDDLKAQSALILRNIDEAYSVMLAEFFKTAFTELGGRVLLDTGYRGKAVDFATIISNAKELHPDVIYLPGYTRDSGLFIKQAKRMGIKSTFLGGDAWDEIENFAGADIEGSYQSAPWHPQAPFPKSRHLQELYQRKFHRQIVNMSAPLAYDAVYLLANAIEQAGSLDRSAIRVALAATRRFQGATGLISFDDNGDPENKEVLIIQFRNGKRAFYKTIRP
jgi:branched-chain amino acid transport system substrate-binding protein